jgi:hypothetical protein
VDADASDTRVKAGGPARGIAWRIRARSVYFAHEMPNPDAEPENSMSKGVQDTDPVNAARPDPLQEFVDFCEAEFVRRRNTGVSFDEDAYRKAMRLVLDRMKALDGRAGAR